ncbi:MAG TPA: 4Fe-4S dicluster domain-containing protein [candidate division WOR-3 bacterium]|uniref:Ion-translocating oxidoreductase complex subunit B n=1 Tax=candidate division WOR-3 bacterium TaxID=2052148 RepID=A0A7V0XGC0_UNCW3|nr:4Fe-4S dicluster domain-containing protein [candidate division WOR-3 bacterium]
MDWALVLKAMAGLGGLGLLLGLVLLIASKKLAVRIDPREELARAALPGVNCGACGFPGCDGYAAAVVTGKAALNACPVGGPAVARRLGEIMGQDVDETEPLVAKLICRGGIEQATQRFHYEGTYNCRQAALLLGGPKACVYGCIGMGHCVTVCPVDAIRLGPDRLPVIDEKKCVGCAACVRECPKQVIRLLRRSKLVYLACANHDKGRQIKSVCKVGCIACGLCVRNCPTNALELVNNLPVMDEEKCIDCGICVHKCPTRSFVDRAKGRPKAVINKNCTGCTLCATKACKFKAIEGEPKQPHKVISAKCIGCGECVKVCPVDAIDMVGALGHAARTT